MEHCASLAKNVFYSIIIMVMQPLPLWSLFNDRSNPLKHSASSSHLIVTVRRLRSTTMFARDGKDILNGLGPLDIGDHQAVF